MPRRSAAQYALYLLGRRARTQRELRQKLTDKGYELDQVEKVLQNLQDINLINDEQFAHNYAQDKVRIYRRGRHRIGLELIHKGIDKELVKQATEKIKEEDELEAAKSLLKGKERNWANLTDRKRFERSISLLQRRGFSGSVIRQAISKD